MLALVGSTRKQFVSNLEEFLKKHDHVWSGWTYRILPRDLVQLEEQKKELGYFLLYFHYRKSCGGSGDIESIAEIDDWSTDTGSLESPEPSYTIQDELDWYNQKNVAPAKTWVRITQVNYPRLPPRASKD